MVPQISFYLRSLKTPKCQNRTPRAAPVLWAWSVGHQALKIPWWDDTDWLESTCCREGGRSRRHSVLSVNFFFLGWGDRWKAGKKNVYMFSNVLAESALTESEKNNCKSFQSFLLYLSFSCRFSPNIRVSTSSFFLRSRRRQVYIHERSGASSVCF